MPLHTRKTPERIRSLSLCIESLIDDIDSAMDGIKLSAEQASGPRWPITASSLHLAGQHARAAYTLILAHDNTGAGVHLRALFEIYIRLAYMLSTNDNHRLVATLYADAIKYENRYKDIRKVSSSDKTTLPGYENYDEDFLATIDQRIQEAHTARQSYRMKLNELKPEEFLDEKKNLLKSGEICKKLSLIYMCKKLDEAGIHDPILASHLHSYTHIYSTLSEHAHISTVYLASTVHTDKNNTTRIGTISEDKNEYESILSLVSAYLVLMEIFLIAKREGGEKESAISSLRNSYRAKINDFAQYLAD